MDENEKIKKLNEIINNEILQDDKLEIIEQIKLFRIADNKYKKFFKEKYNKKPDIQKYLRKKSYPRGDGIERNELLIAVEIFQDQLKKYSKDRKAGRVAFTKIYDSLNKDEKEYVKDNNIKYDDEFIEHTGSIVSIIDMMDTIESKTEVDDDQYLDEDEKKKRKEKQDTRNRIKKNRDKLDREKNIKKLEDQAVIDKKKLEDDKIKEEGEKYLKKQNDKKKREDKEDKDDEEEDQFIEDQRKKFKEDDKIKKAGEEYLKKQKKREEDKEDDDDDEEEKQFIEDERKKRKEDAKSKVQSIEINPYGIQTEVLTELEKEQDKDGILDEEGRVRREKIRLEKLDKMINDDRDKKKVDFLMTISKQDPTLNNNSGVGMVGGQSLAIKNEEGNYINIDRDSYLSNNAVNQSLLTDDPLAQPTTNINKPETQTTEEEEQKLDNDIKKDEDRPSRDQEQEDIPEYDGRFDRPEDIPADKPEDRPYKEKVINTIRDVEDDRGLYDVLIPREDAENDVNLNNSINSGVKILEKTAERLNIDKMKLGIKTFHTLYDNEIPQFREKSHIEDKEKALKSNDIKTVRNHFLKMEVLVKTYLGSLGGDLSIGVIISANDFHNKYKDYYTEDNDITNNITNIYNENDKTEKETTQETKEEEEEEKPRRRLGDNNDGLNNHFSNHDKFNLKEKRHIYSIKGNNPHPKNKSVNVLTRQGGMRHRFSQPITGKLLNVIIPPIGIGNIENPSEYLRQDPKNAQYVRENILRRNPANFIIPA